MRMLQANLKVLQGYVAAAVAVSIAVSVARAEDDSSEMTMGELCELGGGFGQDLPGGGYICCWADWGCLECDADGVCEMNCDTRRCCEANGDCYLLIFPEGVDANGTIDQPGGPRDLSDLALNEDLALDNTPNSGGTAPVHETAAADMREMFRSVAPPNDESTEKPVAEATQEPACGAFSLGAPIFGAVALFGVGRSRRMRR